MWEGAALWGKIWRQPTLAEPIGPLPLARLRLTAEFGMGSGRATALWSPKNLMEVSSGAGFPVLGLFVLTLNCERANPRCRFSENYI